MAELDTTNLTVQFLKDLIDFIFQNIEDNWDEITKSKENDKPENHEIEWILVQGQLQLVKETMQELNQDAVIPHVNPKNLNLVIETMRFYFETYLYPEGLAQDQQFQGQWAVLYRQIRTLRNYLLNIHYNEPD